MPAPAKPLGRGGLSGYLNAMPSPTFQSNVRNIVASIVKAEDCVARPADQALMTWWPLRPPIAILRGFARSATGIRNRSTPAS
jgi:hypothetical protein